MFATVGAKSDKIQKTIQNLKKCDFAKFHGFGCRADSEIFRKHERFHLNQRFGIRTCQSLFFAEVRFKSVSEFFPSRDFNFGRAAKKKSACNKNNFKCLAPTVAGESEQNCQKVQQRNSEIV